MIDWRGREAELEVSANPFAPVVLAHLGALKTPQDHQGRRQYKIQLVKGLYQHGWKAEDVRQLFRVIDWLLDLPWDLQDGFQEELHQWEEENRMPYITSVERYGIEKGLREGMREGLQEGIAAALAAKFGKASKRLRNRMRKIQEVENLRAILKAIPEAKRLQEIRDLIGQG